MGNILPRVGLELTCLAFQANILSLHHTCSLMSPLYQHLPVYAAPRLRGQCRLLHLSPWNCKCFIDYTCIHTGSELSYIQTGQVQQPYSILLVQDGGHVTSDMGVIKIGNIVLRAGLEPTSLAVQANILPLHHTCSLMSPLYQRLPVYVAPCLRSQCRLLLKLAKALPLC